MDDRTMIAAMAMQGMLTALGGSGNDKDLAERAVSKADALLKALAESEAERPRMTTSDDQRLVTGVDLEFLSPRPAGKEIQPLLPSSLRRASRSPMSDKHICGSRNAARERQGEQG